MAREYIARDPRTGRPIRRQRLDGHVDIRGLLPSTGLWQRIPVHEILPLARGESDGLELPRSAGGGFVRRSDAIKALHRVFESQVDLAHQTLLDALDDDDSEIRIASLEILPIFALKKHEDLLHCLSDRLLEDDPQVIAAARECFIRVAPVFPSGCENILRRELRDKRMDHRANAFETLRRTAQNWPEAGCLHLDELIREEDVDLRRRGSRILRAIAANGGATGWDLIGWSLEDEDAQVRRNASYTLTTLTRTEPRMATIFIESAIMDDDAGVRKSVIRALKRLDMQNPRVTKMIIDGARSRDYTLRKACIDQLSIMLSGDTLRETAAELLRHETRPDLCKRLTSLAKDVEMEGSEEEKNRFLAPLDKVEPSVEEFDAPRSGEATPEGEHDKQRSGRPHSEDSA
ncbi:HEAT repeat domain-containing protein [Candidatus Thalassarchaeum betae]|uniref:HEAT repeat domain-containing protein n=1 Tax=Candidatus Thalassarchaeum betae TaxID=2599289 RepID=UPI0030C66503|nr:HEAT repeat domain-containing protein [Candidatus Thalassoarchaea betae]